MCTLKFEQCTTVLLVNANYPPPHPLKCNSPSQLSVSKKAKVRSWTLSILLILTVYRTLFKCEPGIWSDVPMSLKLRSLWRIWPRNRSWPGTASSRDNHFVAQRAWQMIILLFNHLFPDIRTAGHYRRNEFKHSDDYSSCLRSCNNGSSSCREKEWEQRMHHLVT